MKILAVDDEDDTLDFLRDVLASAGHEVTTAADAGAAMAAVQTDRFDVVLLDIMMPGMDGIEFQQWMRRHWDVAEVPVIMISCLTDAGSKEQARVHGCFDYIEKPFRLKRLFEVLRQLERGQDQGAMLES